MSAALTSVAMATRPSVMQARRNGGKQRGQCRAEKETRAEYQTDACLQTSYLFFTQTPGHMDLQSGITLSGCFCRTAFIKTSAPLSF
ncbi:hypothetical protein QQF64_003683 [Cirrhinus molitorella]|uniref:Uncharacterized protein n=1 Tax=Cirrhinus molitorella TaxID=172907 RepID=A0ABR3MM05_9TELE